MFTKCTKRPLISKVILLAVLIGYKFIVFLVYRVISQMHKFVLFVYFLSISLRCKSCKTLLMNIDTKRLVTCYTYINAQVEFVTVN